MGASVAPWDPPRPGWAFLLHRGAPWSLQPSGAQGGSGASASPHSAVGWTPGLSGFSKEGSRLSHIPGVLLSLSCLPVVFTTPGPDSHPRFRSFFLRRNVEAGAAFVLCS